MCFPIRYNMKFFTDVTGLECLAGDIEDAVMYPILLLYYTFCNFEIIEDRAGTTAMNTTYILEKALSYIPLE